MGVQKNGKYAFGVVRPDYTIDIVESVGWVHGFGVDGRPELRLWDEDYEVVAIYHEWVDVRSELDSDVLVEEPV